MLHYIIKEKIFEEIPVVNTNFHECHMTIHKWRESYSITGDLDDNDPLDIIYMCQKGYVKWKEFKCMEIHGTLFDMT